MAQTSEQTLIAEVEQRLIDKFPEISPDQVVDTVRQAHAQFDQSPIRDFVPLLVERHARAELAKGAKPALASS